MKYVPETAVGLQHYEDKSEKTESYCFANARNYLRGVLLAVLRENNFDPSRDLVFFHPNEAFCSRIKDAFETIGVDCDVFNIEVGANEGGKNKQTADDDDDGYCVIIGAKEFYNLFMADLCIISLIESATKMDYYMSIQGRGTKQ